ncbi:phosphate/phosphite/phosphonate ABC transporter substrate-binding protein [Pseudoduganella buxea]|uniref:PhnD/SsuA/transferrin family substrate-binding protein n=1 Tax=Pseudoduganella buxea TaxID=1949069 RepID=A0A6I3SSX0_9BURK|nr:PhnD/SsuA/transferrin family substrate-binding protein [Pseudoduganella buxea]MTV52260.1 PhnD/SsuA/transferrin family substrate-binding protein [Pseudoduganella buxea]GGB86867.1 phosphate ABC transporter substrate-binding protein [Pseudoduganella buxea]
MSWQAALPMYNVSSRLGRAYEKLLAAWLAQAGVADDVAIARDVALPDFWTRPDMLVSQTCGYPYIATLHGKVALLATPCHELPGCTGSDYASAMIVRADRGIATLDQARGLVAAVNDRHSNSGMNLLRHAVAPLARDGRFFGDVKWSGSHAASVHMVREGAADIAAIDCVTFAYLRQEDPAAVAGLAVLQYSAAAPGLPLIAGGNVPEAWVTRLRGALLAPGPALLATMRPLRIAAFRHCDAAAYGRIGQLEALARQWGYAALA